MHGIDSSRELLGRVALVTGGGGGVGRLAAERLAIAGCSVVVVDLDAPLARRTAGRIRSDGGRALAIPLSATCLGDARQAVQRALEAFSRVDVLVNSLAAFPCGWLATLPRPLLPSALELNLRATLFFSEAVAEHMVDAGSGGAVVNLMPRALFADGPLMATAQRLIELTRSLAHRLSPHGVRVNAIAADHDEGRPYRRRLPGSGLEDVAELVLLLASPAAASVTGSLIVTDEGPLPA